MSSSQSIVLNQPLAQLLPRLTNSLLSVEPLAISETPAVNMLLMNISSTLNLEIACDSLSSAWSEVITSSSVHWREHLVLENRNDQRHMKDGT